MPRTHRNRRARLTAAALLLLPAALGLAACGESSKGSSATNAATSAANGKRSGQFAARPSALRKCLKKNGITLPERKAGQGGPGVGGPGGPYSQPPNGAQGGRGPFGPGAGPQLPKGVTRAQLEAAMKKCGGGVFRRGRGFDSAQGRQRFAKFAECMRKNGIDLPAPNTSGNGPVFNTKGIDTSSAEFKAANATCMKELRPGGDPGQGEGGAAPDAPGSAPEGPPPGAY